MDPIKDAFTKVKEEMNFLKTELDEIQKELAEIQISILNLVQNSTDRQTDTRQTDKTDNQTHKPKKPTLRQINTTDFDTSTHTSTDSRRVQPFKHPNLYSSIGNRGASTDRQTDRHMDNSTQKNMLKSPKIAQISQKP